jgi:hypothetical protein
MYIQYIQGLCQPRFSTADHVPSHVAYATVLTCTGVQYAILCLKMLQDSTDCFQQLLQSVLIHFSVSVLLWSASV